MSTNRKWLIISYFSGIDALAPSHHIDDRIPRLREIGVEPIVLSSACSPGASGYPTIRTPSIAPSGLRYEMRYVTRRRIANGAVRRLVQLPIILALLPGYAVEKMLVNLDCTWSWHITAAAAAVKMARKHDVELIYSTGGPASAHMAALHCSRATGIPWIAEYQDLTVGEWIPRSPSVRRFNKAQAAAVARHASAVVYMTRMALEEMESNVEMGERGRFVYPGADPDVFGGVRPLARHGRQLVIGHFGSFGGDRNAGVMLDTLEHLVSRHPSAREHVRLRLVGDMDRAQDAMLKAFPFREMLDVWGKRSRAESLQAMLGCDLLLIIQNASRMSSVSIPSKTYEYLHSGVPVMGLTYENPELDHMLTDLGHFALDLRDARGVRETVERAYLDWRESGRIVADIRPSPYTTAAAAGALMDIARSVSARQA